MDLNVKAFVEMATRASTPRWPAVRQPLVKTRNIAVAGKQIFWPCRDRLLPECLGYVSQGDTTTMHIRHPAVVEQIDPEAAIRAEMECRDFIEQVERELALVKEIDPNYTALKEETDAMLLAGVISAETASMLGDRLPLAPCVFLVERLTDKVWPGRQVRHLVDELMSGRVMTSITIEIDMSYGGLPSAVTINMFGELRLFFRLWEHGWGGNAPALLVVEDEQILGWDSISRAVAAFCPSPSDAVALKHAVLAILEILEEQP